MLTALGDLGLLRGDGGSGADDFLTKPIAREDLDARLLAAARGVDLAETRPVTRTELDARLAQARCWRWATAAACVRLRTPSFDRIRETWTLAVFSAM